MSDVSVSLHWPRASSAFPATAPAAAHVSAADSGYEPWSWPTRWNGR